MGRKTSRKAISLRGDNVSMSTFVEERIAAFFGYKFEPSSAPPRLKRIAEAAERLKQQRRMATVGSEKAPPRLRVVP